MPTTKTTITITDLQDAAGNLLGNAWLTVRLNAGGNAVEVDGVAVAKTAKVQTDADGDASIQLYPNEAFDVEDTFYTIAVDETSPLIYRTIRVPTGGGTYAWTADAIQVEAVPFDGPYPGGTTGSAGQVVARKSSGNGFELVNHNSIAGRSTASAHPISAITGLQEALDTLSVRPAGVELGETSATAYRGDRGKTAYDHSQDTTTNPHSVTKAQVGLANVTNDSQVKRSEVSTFGFSLLDDLDAAEARATLGAMASSATLPWKHRVLLPMYCYPDTVTGTWTLSSAITGLWPNAAITGTTASSSSWTWANLPLAAGTWAIDMWVARQNSTGIATFTLGGASIGTIDTYNATDSWPVRLSLTGITVGSSGYADLVLSNPTKNASSSGYLVRVYAIVLRRTGA